jgi:hypothetical protein
MRDHGIEADNGWHLLLREDRRAEQHEQRDEPNTHDVLPAAAAAPPIAV